MNSLVRGLISYKQAARLTAIVARGTATSPIQSSSRSSAGASLGCQMPSGDGAACRSASPALAWVTIRTHRSIFRPIGAVSFCVFRSFLFVSRFIGFPVVVGGIQLRRNRPGIHSHRFSRPKVAKYYHAQTGLPPLPRGAPARARAAAVRALLRKPRERRDRIHRYARSNAMHQ